MKIQHNPQIQQAMQTYRKNRAAEVQPKENTASFQDKIEFSAKAQEFQAALKAYQQLPQIREERVEEARTKMENGQMASPEEVAEKMLMGLNRRSTF